MPLFKERCDTVSAGCNPAEGNFKGLVVRNTKPYPNVPSGQCFYYREEFAGLVTATVFKTVEWC